MECSTTTLALHTGVRIRRERMRRDLSQEQLAEKSGLTAQYISLLENGNRCGSLEAYLNIANAFGISLGDLFSDRNEDGDYSDDEHRILYLFYSCSPPNRKIMIAVFTAVYGVLQSEPFTPHYPQETR